MPSDATAPLDLDERRRLLDEWVAVRKQMARLEAKASSLLAERIRAHDLEVSEQPYHRDAIYRSMIAEYSAAGHLSKGAVEFAFADALAVATSLPTIGAAFATGRITASHVRELVRAAAIVTEAVRNGRADAEVQVLYENAVLVVAETDTPARTRAHARQVAAALVGESLVERHRRAAEERCVTVRSLDDGLALLTAVLPETLAVAIHDRVTRLARQVMRRDDASPSVPSVPWMLTLDEGFDPFDAILPEDIALDDVALDDPLVAVIFGDSATFTTDPLAGLVDPLAGLVDPWNGDGGEAPSATASLPKSAHASESAPASESMPASGAAAPRTIDQVRADLFTDLLLASDPGAAVGHGLDSVQARIQVTVAATTLAGFDERPAQLDGYGPLDPEIARALAGRNNGWSRLFLDSGGMVAETDTYTPTEGMRRFLRARDQHCRFPGCRMPVHRCEIDHNHDHAKGGRTRLDNLSHFCTGHHSLKHPDIGDGHRWTARALPDGAIEWKSPLGRTYPDHPSRRVMFV